MSPLNKLLKRFEVHVKIGVAGRCQINNVVTSLESDCLPPKKTNKKKRKKRLLISVDCTGIILSEGY